MINKNIVYYMNGNYWDTILDLVADIERIQDKYLSYDEFSDLVKMYCAA